MSKEKDDCKRDKVEIDKCLMPIITALNNAGIKTIASCCGHTFQPSIVSLIHNGVEKELRLLTYEQGRKIDKLFPDVNGNIDKMYIYEIEQLKAENERSKKLLKEIIEIAEDHYNSIGSDGSYGAITGIVKKVLNKENS